MHIFICSRMLCGALLTNWSENSYICAVASPLARGSGEHNGHFTQSSPLLSEGRWEIRPMWDSSATALWRCRRSSPWQPKINGVFISAGEWPVWKSVSRGVSHSSVYTHKHTRTHPHPHTHVFVHMYTSMDKHTKTHTQICWHIHWPTHTYLWTSRKSLSHTNIKINVLEYIHKKTNPQTHRNTPLWKHLLRV